MDKPAPSISGLSSTSKTPAAISPLLPSIKPIDGSGAFAILFISGNEMSGDGSSSPLCPSDFPEDPISELETKLLTSSES